jgi:hypothetical protein
MAKHTQNKPESRRRLALARPGIDHKQPFFDGFGSHFGILHLFALFHFGAVTCVVHALV